MPTVAVLARLRSFFLFRLDPLPTHASIRLICCLALLVGVQGFGASAHAQGQVAVTVNGEAAVVGEVEALARAACAGQGLALVPQADVSAALHFVTHGAPPDAAQARQLTQQMGLRGLLMVDASVARDSSLLLQLQWVGANSDTRTRFGTVPRSQLAEWLASSVRELLGGPDIQPVPSPTTTPTSRAVITVAPSDPVAIDVAVNPRVREHLTLRLSQNGNTRASCVAPCTTSTSRGLYDIGFAVGDSDVQWASRPVSLSGPQARVELNYNNRSTLRLAGAIPALVVFVLGDIIFLVGAYGRPQVCSFGRCTQPTDLGLMISGGILALVGLAVANAFTFLHDVVDIQVDGIHF